ncbi:TrbC/VirB2 family protein [Neorhizobium galegae]|uniref:TrbC/VirB2 family protein n=1 Tax=Neorhizobium galegae TaxID=399 RepID=UPI0006218A88|nr:TrbC/VirB2 family protein [Neorhizobium galegae]KAB1110884.1 TrbC/VirB2 family protein [Neorhizobium galegae]MCQ1768115.1 TrbC/VirB2 family protein [Neorhizobium galegae]MCQ1847087.1 TrbC/VirB2 family protein [Neorhizobium galegae]CDZ29976.1 Type IV secretion system TrbC/VirB2 family protein [Neorhizobium galegae bv. officinalis]
MNMLAVAVLYGSVACRSMIKRRWVGHTVTVFVAAMILVVSQYEPAAAQNLNALQNAADRLVQFFTGPFGRSVGAIAFIGMFLAAAFGYWSWGALLRVGGSLAGMFAAAELVDFLAGSGS